MKRWMNRLAKHHQKMKQLYPDDDTMVVFDIDDTILDLRHMILHVLTSFDRRHGTPYFHRLAVDDILASETGISRLMADLGVPRPERKRILDWFAGHSWSPAVVRDGHRPFPGALDVIRWLRLQQRTFVGLNTGRPESIRKETLESLQRIGRPHGVAFSDDLLFMSRYAWGERIPESKAEGIRHFQQLGYRIASFVDNEPENLRAVSECDETGEILLLHADTIFSSGRDTIPRNAVSGSVYDVAELIRDPGRRDEFGQAA